MLKLEQSQGNWDKLVTLDVCQQCMLRHWLSSSPRQVPGLGRVRGVGFSQCSRRQSQEKLHNEPCPRSLCWV